MRTCWAQTQFEQLDGWAEHDHQAAFAAFRHSASFLLAHPPKSRKSDCDLDALLEIAAKVLELPEDLPQREARSFFESHFAPFTLTEEGLLTGYYEPEFDARLKPDADYCYPLHRRPADLFSLSSKEALSAGFTEETSFARKTNQGLRFHHSRGEVMDGALDDQNLAFAWLKDPFEAYIIHIQGSARLRLADNHILRVTFDGKSGQPYKSLGKLLIDKGIFTVETITMDGLIAYLREQGEAGYRLLAENPSYIYFKPVDDPVLNRAEIGPAAAAQIPLISMRSIAVDRHLHTFGTPFWLETNLPQTEDSKTFPFRQLCFAHDTGSAIKGAARADLFCGTGEDAGTLAGRLQQPTRFTCLLPIIADGKHLEEAADA